MDIAYNGHLHFHTFSLRHRAAKVPTIVFRTEAHLYTFHSVHKNKHWLLHELCCHVCRFVWSATVPSKRTCWTSKRTCWTLQGALGPTCLCTTELVIYHGEARCSTNAGTTLLVSHRLASPRCTCLTSHLQIMVNCGPLRSHEEKSCCPQGALDPDSWVQRWVSRLTMSIHQATYCMVTMVQSPKFSHLFPPSDFERMGTLQVPAPPKRVMLRGPPWIALMRSGLSTIHSTVAFWILEIPKLLWPPHP